MAEINKILEIDFDSKRVPNLLIRSIHETPHRQEPIPNDVNPMKDMFVIREALLATILYIEQIGLMKKGAAMKMAIDGLNEGYMECGNAPEAAKFDTKRNLEVQPREFEIWMEGYVATGESSGASLLGKGVGRNFDEAVKDFMSKNPNHGIEANGRERYMNDQAYENRRSNWNIWACSLFDNEADARKSFG